MPSNDAADRRVECDNVRLKESFDEKALVRSSTIRAASSSRDGRAFLNGIQ